MNVKTIGIALILNGLPIIFFIRDDLSISPQSFYFTGIMMSSFLLLLVSSNLFKIKFYKPNFLLFLPASIFIIYSIARLIISDYEYKHKDVFYFSYLMLYFLLLLSVERRYLNKLHLSFVFVTLIDNLLLIKFSFKDISEIGARLYLGETGNPNISAFIAFWGIVASYLTIRYENNFFRIIAYINILTGLYVILITQSRTTFVVLVIFSLLLGAKTLKKGFLNFPSLFKFKKTLLINVFIFPTVFLIFWYTLVPQNITSTYLANFSNYLQGLVETVLYQAGDTSSMERIISLEYFREVFYERPQDLIIGLGYKNRWLDIPILQAFVDLGIIGGFSLVGFHLALIYSIYRIVKEKSIETHKLLLCMMYPLIAFNSLSHGQPYDLSFWLYFATVIRFLKVNNT